MLVGERYTIDPIVILSLFLSPSFCSLFVPPWEPGIIILTVPGSPIVSDTIGGAQHDHANCVQGFCLG